MSVVDFLFALLDCLRKIRHSAFCQRDNTCSKFSGCGGRFFFRSIVPVVVCDDFCCESLSWFSFREIGISEPCCGAFEEVMNDLN